MAEKDRNRGGSSYYQDWNEESNRYGRSDYDDRGMGGTYGGSQYSRYGQDYGEGSTYGPHSNTESDYNRYGDYSKQSRYDRDYDRDYYRGRTYGGFGDINRGFGSTRYDRDFTNYAPGGYQNYGGGAGFGGGYLSGGYGGGSYGRPLSSRGYSTDYGIYSDEYPTGGYGSDYGTRARQDYGRRYDRDYEGTYRPYGDKTLNRPKHERSWWDKTTDEVSSWFGDDDAERRRRMDSMYSHRGKGPRNYQRSDERIKEDINDRLSDDWLVDATDIEVAVQNGDVTLTGTVDERMAKRRAEDLADSVSGVKNVENRIRVTRETVYPTGAAGAATTGVGSTERSRSRQSNVATDTSRT